MLLLLPSRNRWPCHRWLPYALTFSCAALLWLKFQLRFAEVGLWRTLGFGLELVAFGWAAQKCFRWASESSQNSRSEACRWLCLSAVSLLLTLPYARPERVGAGDAQDYAEHLADFIEQMRYGVFPVLVGQSRFAFNGAFNPLRTAPYFQYFGGALSALSFGVLAPFALQNLEIILSLFAAAFCSYFCLRRFAPRRPWLCLQLALLYISSPGVLALVYAGDMIPSWLTLPYLPLYTFFLIRIADDGIGGRRLNGIAAVLALLWAAHAPIALWLSILALPAIGVRLAMAAAVNPPRSLRLVATALLVFIVLAGFEFVSVLQLNLPGVLGPTHGHNEAWATSILGAGWKGLLRPVSAGAGDLLSDLQLSPGLWLCLILGFLGWRKGGWGLRALLLAAICLLALLVPVPRFAVAAWKLVPVWVGSITDLWPMQRFLPILSVFAPFAALLACQSGWLKGPRATKAVMGILAVACMWSGIESWKFLKRGYAVALPASFSHMMSEGQNTVFAVYSYGMLGVLPRYFSYGPMKSDMQVHLLDATSHELIETNQMALRSGRVPIETKRTRTFQPIAGGATLDGLELPPGKSYVLFFNFKDTPAPGTLVLSGHDILRKYPLPASGGDRAFGAGNEHSSAIALSVTGSIPESLTMRYMAVPGYRLSPKFADVTIVSYLSSDLPLRVLSLIPYRLSIRAPKGSWVETPRIFIRGYQAKVNGHAAELARSPDGLVMVRVPAGESAVELKYEGSFLLRSAFWISLLGWGAFVLGLVLRVGLPDRFFSNPPWNFYWRSASRPCDGFSDPAIDESASTEAVSSLIE